MAANNSARTERAWLDVPYSEKDEAKAAGGRWAPHLERPDAPDQRAQAPERTLADHRAGPERNAERGAHRS